MHEVRELRAPGRADVDRRVSGQREARAQAEPEQERRPEQDRPFGEPREEEDRGDDRKAQRHDDERGAEAGSLRQWGQVSVHEADERKLERIARPQQEGEDPELDAGDDSQGCDQVEASLQRGRRPPADHQQAEGEPADEQREPEEVAPADDVLVPGRARGAIRLRGRRRHDPHPERVDPRDDVALQRGHVPAHRVGAGRQPLQRSRRHVVSSHV